MELAVVVASLGILFVMLLPALAGTKSQSRITACAARFRQWAVSANLYATDHQDILPSGNTSGGGSYIWDVGINLCSALYPYGMDVPDWFCPMRPFEMDEANRWAVEYFGPSPTEHQRFDSILQNKLTRESVI